MADFVAVIRRAVDGLANNTPEMRVKVYEKARSAVIRQLESMKPAPPEALFKRQIDKLDQAIAEVEAEYAEALPAEEPVAAVAPPVFVAPEPVAAAPVVPPQPAFVPPPVVAAPLPLPVEPVWEEPKPVYDEPVFTQPEPQPEPVWDEPAAAPAREEPVFEEPAYEEPVTAADAEERFEQAERGFDDALPEAQGVVDAAPDDFPPIPRRDERDDPFASVVQAWDETPAAPSDKADRSWDWPETNDLLAPAVAPAAAPAGEQARSSDALIDDFDAYLEGRTTGATPVALEPVADPVPVAPAAPAAPKQGKEAWDDFEALIGYGNEPVAGASAPAAPVAPAVEKTVASADIGFGDLPPGEVTFPYRAVPKPRPSIAKMGIGALAVLLIASGSYALWLNRDAMTTLFSGPAQPSGTPVVSHGNGSTTPATSTSEQATTPATKPDAAAGSTKFTQRLMADGKEVDAGQGAAQTGGSREGTSVAEKNVASQPPGTGVSNAGASGAATATQAPQAAGDKMYLYEEKVGQSTPTAIEGSVKWEFREEKDDNGRPEGTVQGTINVPGKNLTALVTFKRNSDPSLPASHLVEIVFSIPAGFEGGAIESVQRISMKSTEQDRGNPLIAVPARITDDFHMVALNDFADARKANMELLKSRNWMDIPVTYRNGRRALLTMEKGTDGTAAFNKAIGQWATQDGVQ